MFIIIQDNCIINGCLPLDDYAEEVFAELQGSAVDFTTLWDSGDMPVLKFDEAFRSWRREQISECQTLAREKITCLLPWQILKHLAPERRKSERLYFSQGGLGSCMGHADSFAHHSATLQCIARGAPLIYSPFNPVVTWSITKGGSVRGGQSVSEMASGANSIGHFPETLVGTNNQSVPDYKHYLDEAKDYQSAILFLNFKGSELADEIIQCCAAGLSVALGNSTAVSGCTLDKGEIDVTTRDNDGFRATVGGLKECTIEFDTFELDSDTTFTTIKDAWLNDTSIELKALSSATGSGLDAFSQHRRSHHASDDWKNVWRIAGSLHLDPRPFTLRQLIWMSEGRDKHVWNIVSSMMALIANCHRDSKHRALTADDFNPVPQSENQNVILITDENVDMMKNEFIKTFQ